MKNHSDESFREIIIADLTYFTLVLPTTIVGAYSPQHGSERLISKRVYSNYGFVFMDGQDIGTVQGLRIEVVASEDSPIKTSSPLNQTISLTFEMVCLRHLPEAIANQALFLYSFEHDPSLHCGLFQNMVPRFARLYPWEAIEQLPQQVKHFAYEAQQFHLQRPSDMP